MGIYFVDLKNIDGYAYQIVHSEFLQISLLFGCTENGRFP